MTAWFANEAVPLALLRERAFNQRWAQQAEGVIPLTAADPDFPVCPAVQDALIRYVQEGVLGYAPPEGLPAFRETVAQWMRSTRRIDCEARHVFATDSAASALGIVARASLQPGDEVLIPDPVDFLFEHAVRQAGAVAVRVPLSRATTAEAFVAAMAERTGPRTRMLWLCNPHNPLGLVPAREWLEPVASWAVEHGLKILSDEIWSDIVYAPARHTSVASLSADIAPHVVTVHGFSKNFALAGLRVGFLVCTDAPWFQKMFDASDARSTVYGVSVLSQVAATAAIRAGGPWLTAFIAHLQAQRDHVMQRLARWPGVTAVEPQGTYVVLPNIGALGLEAEAVCQRLLDQAGVALVPGSSAWFGPGAQGHLRICFATSRRILDEAFDRMEPVMKALGQAASSTPPRP